MIWREKNSSESLAVLDSKEIPFKAADVIEAHRSLFSGIFNHAGKHSRTIQQFGDFVSVDAAYFIEEMELADKQVSELWEKAETLGEKVDVLAFQHARLVAIHGFEDGNGRVSRLILEGSLANLIEGDHSFDVDAKAGYIKALGQAIGGNDLTALSNVARGIAGIEERNTHRVPSPFEIAPRRDGEDYENGIGKTDSLLECEGQGSRFESGFSRT